MKAFLARWRPAHVVTAWVVYWIGLAAVTLTPTILAISRAASAPKDTANVSVSMANTVLKITVTMSGRVAHEATASLGQMALWIGVPPLALYALWLFTRRRPGGAPASLGEGDPDVLPRPAAPDAADTSHVHSRAPHA